MAQPAVSKDGAYVPLSRNGEEAFGNGWRFPGSNRITLASRQTGRESVRTDDPPARSRERLWKQKRPATELPRRGKCGPKRTTDQPDTNLLTSDDSKPRGGGMPRGGQTRVTFPRWRHSWFGRLRSPSSSKFQKSISGGTKHNERLDVSGSQATRETRPIAGRTKEVAPSEMAEFFIAPCSKWCSRERCSNFCGDDKAAGTKPAEARPRCDVGRHWRGRFIGVLVHDSRFYRRLAGG